VSARRAFGLALLAFLVRSLFSCAPPEPPAPEGTNVLLVTIDTLRADRLGAYGNDSGLTPNLDRLAQSGVLFENASAVAPLTLPAHASILTGTYPLRHGIRDKAGFIWTGRA
jgi:arylsulfatase A-like enzyme